MVELVKAISKVIKNQNVSIIRKIIMSLSISNFTVFVTYIDFELLQYVCVTSLCLYIIPIHHKVHCPFYCILLISASHSLWCFTINFVVLHGLYSATNCADNILGRFTLVLQNQIARVDSFTNLTKILIFRFRLNASISSHDLIFFGKQFHARGPYTANARLPKVSCVNFGTFRTRSSLDLMEYLLLFDGVFISWM